MCMNEIYLVSIDVVPYDYGDSPDFYTIPVCYFDSRDEAEKFMKYHESAVCKSENQVKYFINNNLLPKDTFENLLYGSDDDVSGVYWEVLAIKKGKTV